MHVAFDAASPGTAAALATGTSGWRRFLGRPVGGLPAVLAYHKVGTPELGGTWCSVRQFAAHLDALTRANVRGIDVEHFARCLATVVPAADTNHTAPKSKRLVPTGELARREVLITFDDAYASFAAKAWPMLRARAFPSLLFVITDFAGRKSRWDLPFPGRRVWHLDWDELRALHAEGVAIGSHSMTHRDLTRLDDHALRRELEGSRHRLEDALGAPIRALSYPFGRCDARVAAAAAAAGYALGFAMSPLRPDDRVQPLALRRFGVYIVDSPRAVLDKVDASRRFWWVQDLFTRGVSAVAALAARNTGNIDPAPRTARQAALPSRSSDSAGEA